MGCRPLELFPSNGGQDGVDEVEEDGQEGENLKDTQINNAVRRF